MELVVAVLFAALAVTASVTSSQINIQDTPGLGNVRDAKPSSEETRRAARIIGGTTVVPHSSPWMAALVKNTTEDGFHVFCGGSIISSNAILTAARCVYGLSNVTALLGAHNIEISEPGRISVTSSEIIIYDYYFPTSPSNDLAILKFATAFPSTSAIQPIALAPAGHNNYSDYVGNMRGWGRQRNYFETDFTDILRGTRQFVIQNYECYLWYGDFASTSKICAEYWLSGPCVGDFGGPLVVNSTSGVPTQIGIFSRRFGLDDWCESFFPAVYTRVSYFRDFIDEEMSP